jgi:hypothetical protein
MTASPDASSTFREAIRSGSPEALMAVVPFLLGFMPESSFVIVGEPPGDAASVTLRRLDLPDPADPGHATLRMAMAKYAVALLKADQFHTAAAIGYGPAPLVTPLAEAFAHEADKAGIGIGQLVRTEDGRYWSYSSQNPDWFPAEGTPFDPSGHPAWTALSAARGPVLSGRSAVAASIAPVTGAAAESMRRATRRAWRYLSRFIQGSLPQDNPAAAKALADRGVAAVRDVIATYRDGRTATDYQVARLTVALTNIRVRDDACARMDPDYLDCHLRMWTDVVRRAQPRHVAGPASLLAYVAWQAGNGVLANLALDRALADDPGYTMAEYLGKVIMLGVPPSSMTRLTMTPKQVTAHYRALDEAG